MPRPQFSIRTLLWLTLVVAAFLGAIGILLSGMRKAAIERANRHRPAAEIKTP